MNEERLLKIIQDMSETVTHLKECDKIIREKEDDPSTVFIIFGLKQIFVDFFITVEDFTSLMLKELKEFKIGIDMRESLERLQKRNVLDEEVFVFLNQVRLLRNRISHRYKEPSKQELMNFIGEHMDMFGEVLEMVKNIIRK